MRWALLLLLVLVLILPACGNDDHDNKNHEAAETPESVPATLSLVLVRLQRHYESLLASQQAIGEVWERLATNETVQCGSYPDAPNPEAVSAEDDASLQSLADLLRQAAADIDHAITLWRAECTNPRQFPPPAVIDEGRRAARSAGDALREAETLLADLR